MKRTPCRSCESSIRGAADRGERAKAPHSSRPDASLADQAATLGMVGLLLLGGVGLLGLRLNDFYSHLSGSLVEVMERSTEIAP
jgi:hypothetical protein